MSHKVIALSEDFLNLFGGECNVGQPPTLTLSKLC